MTHRPTVTFRANPDSQFHALPLRSTIYAHLLYLLQRARPYAPLAGNVTATSHVYEHYDETLSVWSPSELHIVLEVALVIVGSDKRRVLLQTKEIKSAIMDFIIANSDELGWLFAEEGEYSYNHVQFSSVSGVGHSSVQVCSRIVIDDLDITLPTPRTVTFRANPESQ